MRITIHLQKEAHPIFSRMAKEAGISTSDLAEIACYNLMALYVKDHGVEVTNDIFAAQPDTAPQPNNHSG